MRSLFKRQKPGLRKGKNIDSITKDDELQIVPLVHETKPNNIQRKIHQDMIVQMAMVKRFLEV